MFARHTATMMRGPHGVPVIVGSVRLRGIISQDGDIVDDDLGERVHVARVLTMSATDQPLAVGQAITADGIAYTVRTPPLPMEDGGLVRYGLALAVAGDGTV